MASYDSTRNVVAGQSIANRFFSALTGMTGSFAAWNDKRITRNALSRLSDHELDDLGLSRSDITDMSGLLGR